MNPVMAWFTGNIGYHHIHHLNSRIPFYRLPEVIKALPELQQAKVTTLHPKDIIRCLRLKVWDPQRKQMIGFKELSEFKQQGESQPANVSMAEHIS
jgi:omega-6 fatty acid desaturase (delta-12 desaturase)